MNTRSLASLSRPPIPSSHSKAAFSRSLRVCLVLVLTSARVVEAAPPVMNAQQSFGGQVGTPVASWQLVASNSPTLYTASNLPPGLVLDRTTGVISGTPRVAGSYNVTISASNADGSSFLPYGSGSALRHSASITIAEGSPGPAPAVDASGWSPWVAATLGQPFDRSVSATGTDATTQHVLLGSLPPGLALTAGRISGAPTRSGLYVAELAVTNVNGFTRLPVVIHVADPAASGAPPVFSQPAPVQVQLGEEFEVPLVFKGEADEFAAGPLPPGVYLDQVRRRLYGRPAIPGAHAVVLAGARSGAWSTPVVLSLEVGAGPDRSLSMWFWPSFLERGSAGTSSVLFSAPPSEAAVITDLPEGLTQQNATTIAGTPTRGGFFTPRLTRTNSDGSVGSHAPLVITTPPLEKLAPGTHANVRVLAYGNGRFVRAGTGGLLENSFDQGATWVAVNSGTTRDILHLAYGGGRFVAVGASLALGSADGATWTALTPPPTVNTPTALAVSTHGIVMLHAGGVCTSTDGLTWTAVNDPALASGASGVTPVEGGFAIHYANSLGAGSVRRSNNGITWGAQEPFQSNVYQDLGVGRYGNHFLRHNISGVLESSLDGATWVNRQAYAAFTAILGVAHGEGATLLLGSQGSTRILARFTGLWPSELAALSTQETARGGVFSLQLSATESPHRFHASGLPSGLTLNTSSGLIQGSPATEGDHSVTVAAENALGVGRPVSFTIRVGAAHNPPPVILGSVYAGGEAGEPFSYDLKSDVSGDLLRQIAPEVSLTATNLPPGLQLDTQTGLVSGTPTAAGAYGVDFVLGGRFEETRHRLSARIAPSQWTRSTETGANVRTEIWFSGGRFARQTQDGIVEFSSDGTQWSAPVTVASDQAQLNGFASDGSVHVFCSASAVYVSTDWIAWTRHSLPVTQAYGLLHAAGRFRLLSSLPGPAVLSSLDGSAWESRTLPLPYGRSPVSLAYGNGVFVCTTDYGSVFRSTDGESWEELNPGVPVGGQVAYSSGRFAALSAYASTSIDGRTWVARAMSLTEPVSPLDVVAFGNGFVALGDALYASLDGAHWRRVKTVNTGYLPRVAAGGDKVLVRGTDGSGKFVDSSPGRWLMPTAGSTKIVCRAGAPPLLALAALAPEGGLAWHASSLPPGLALSGDGTISGTPMEPGEYTALVWAVDARGEYPAIVLDFDVRPATGAAPRLHGAAALPDATFATGYSHVLRFDFDGFGETTAVVGLPPGLSYDPGTRTIGGTPRQPGAFDLQVSGADVYGSFIVTRKLRVRSGAFAAVLNDTPLGLAVNASDHIAVGSTIQRSTDGISWSLARQNTFDRPLSPLSGVAAGAGRFVAVGNGGAIVTSTDGLDWQDVASGITQNLSAVTHAAGRWVAVGAGGITLTSTNGLDWTSATANTANLLRAVGHDGTAFFAVGDGGVIRRSIDGQTWTTVTSGVTTALYSFAYGANRYVVGTTNRHLVVSSNGTTWSTQQLPYTSNSSSATRALHYHPVVGFTAAFYDHSATTARILRSANGVTWSALGGYGGNCQSVLATETTTLAGDGFGKLRVFPTSPPQEFVASATSAQAFPGAPFHFDPAPGVTNLTGPFSAIGLPSGLSIDPATGLVSGTPASEGVHDVEIRSSGTTPARLFVRLSVLAGKPLPIPESNGVHRLLLRQGDEVNWTPPTARLVETWARASNSGALPDGLHFDENTGRIRGRVRSSGFYSTQLTATNAAGFASRTIVIGVDAPPPVVTRSPQSLSLGATQPAVFSVETSLGAAARFQWFRNGRALADGSGVAGSRTPVLTLTGVDASSAGDYDVLVSDGLRSALSQPALLTVRVPLAGFHAWAAAHATSLTDATPGAAPFGDGVPNLLRYALGLPFAPVNQTDYLSVNQEGSSLVLRYVRPTGRSDLAYRVEGSRKLQAWSTEGVVHEPMAIQPDPEWTTWEARYPLTSHSSGFLRLVVEPAP